MNTEPLGYSREMYPITEYALSFAWIPVRVPENQSGFDFGVDFNFDAKKRRRPYLWAHIGKTLYQVGWLF